MSSEPSLTLEQWRYARFDDPPAGQGESLRETPDDPFRTRPERDRDRLISSDALRRLGSVSQVASAREEALFLHNRLTHSVKVAGLGRRIALRLLRESEESADVREGIARGGGLDADVVDAAGLAHDLGHPPFGHHGERTLHRLLSREPFYLVDGFEGNPQSFRIVTRLALVRSGLRGLNLTRATLNAILKYPWRYSEYPYPDFETKKWGVFDDDHDIYEEFVRAPGPPSPLAERKRSLEASIMDWADDITYAIHDIEDYYRAGFIPLGQLAVVGRHSSDGSDEPKSPGLGVELASLVRNAKERWAKNPENVESAEKPSDSDWDQAALEITRYPVVGSYDGLSIDKYSLQGVFSLITGALADAPKLDRSGQLKVGLEHRLKVAVLKEMTWRYVIDNPALATQQHGQARLIENLFWMYRDAAIQGNYMTLPARLREELENSLGPAKHRPGLTQDEERVVGRLIADAICAMSEFQVLAMHHRLAGYDLGSLRDVAAF